MKKTRLRGIIIVIVAFVIVAVSLQWFNPSVTGLEIYPSPYLTERKMLSNYNPNLAGTAGDTEVLVFVGEEPGGTLLVVGGSHGDEAAGPATALVFAENAKVTHGRLIVIPFANRSGYTHTLPQEAHPATYVIPTPQGDRVIKFGSRLTNPIHQWPDPTVYVQQVDGQKLAGTEARNLNRAFPGSEKGHLTSMVAWAILELINTENVDVAIDLHESSPEYPVNNAIVAHDRAMEMAVFASLDLYFEGVEIGIEPSPLGLRGLSHREWGDNSEVYAFLLESANAAQGRLRGRTDAELVVSGSDPMYVKSSERGRLYVRYPDHGIPLVERVARHTTTIQALANTFSEFHPDRRIYIDNIPSYADMMASGLGNYLAPTAN